MTLITPREALDGLLATSLPAFVEFTFGVVNPGQEFFMGKHIRAIAHHLELVSRGDIQRLAIALPPRHCKSLCASVAFPAFELGRDPTRRIICASYNADLANGFSFQTRRVMEHPQYRRIFPRTQLDPKRASLEELRTTRHGYRKATSLGGTFTGTGGNILILDDAQKAEEARCETSQQAAGDSVRSTILSRLDNPKDDSIIFVAQRFHCEDLIGQMMELGGWHILELPAIATETQEISIADGVVWVREKGDILQPERVGAEELARLRRELGTLDFEAQYQQCPVPPGGNLVHLAWFPRYDVLPPLGQFEAIVQSWDTAMVPGEGNDYSVCLTFGILGERLYLLDVFRDQLNYPDLRRAVMELKKTYRAQMVVVENMGSGTSLLQDLRGAGEDWIWTKRPMGDKAARLVPQTAKIERGMVFLPMRAPWLKAFEAEIAAFPNGKHDDQVDALSQFLIVLDRRPAPLRFLSFYAGRR